MLLQEATIECDELCKRFEGFYGLLSEDVIDDLYKSLQKVFSVIFSYYLYNDEDINDWFNNENRDLIKPMDREITLEDCKRAERYRDELDEEWWVNENIDVDGFYEILSKWEERILGESELCKGVKLDTLSMTEEYNMFGCYQYIDYIYILIHGRDEFIKRCIEIHCEA